MRKLAGQEFGGQPIHHHCAADRGGRSFAVGKSGYLASVAAQQ
jgi:hypothetical protein